jgi:uncharacterized coiled-coil DUF342 family protein
MPTQLMTYDELAEAWGVSREAARKKVEHLGLRRQTGNDGKARIMVDLTEVQHQPKPKKERRPPGGQAETDALREHVKSLLADIERLNTLASTNRTDFERERERADSVVAELVKIGARLVEVERERSEKHAAAAEAMARVEKMEQVLAAYEAEIAALKARPWWKRAFG